MLGSMFSAVSGLRAHQEMMDVVGDNIANVNTTGFKSSETVFASTLAQVVSSGSAPGNGTGGTDPLQIGLGVRVAATEVNQTQGATQSTGRPTDLLIQGNGYFAVRQGGQQLYTRAGSFTVDKAGSLVDPTGAFVQGWAAAADGTIVTSANAGDLTLPIGSTVPPRATATVTFGGNLSAAAAVGTVVQGPIMIYNTLGETQQITVSMTKLADNSWQVGVTDPTGAVQAGPTLAFDPATGALTTAGSPSFTLPASGGAAASTFQLDFGTAGGSNALTQFGDASSAAALEQDGQPSGTLRSYSIGADGIITGSFSNDQTKVLGQIALATFANPDGLIKAGDNHLSASNASGIAVLGAPGSGTAGSLQSGALEASNVDLAQQFTNLIIAQRGFEANSKVISSADELLQALVNLKR